MTQLSPSAREAAERWLKSLTIEDYGTMDTEGRLTFKRAYELGFLAGVAYQARDSEGKGEAGQAPELAKVQPCHPDEADPPGYLQFDSWCEQKISDGFMQIQCEKCRLFYWVKPPAPKDERDQSNSNNKAAKGTAPAPTQGIETPARRDVAESSGTISKPEADGKPARRDYWLGRKINGDILVFHVRPSTNMLAFHKIRSLEHVTELHPGDRVFSAAEVEKVKRALINLLQFTKNGGEDRAIIDDALAAMRNA